MTDKQARDLTETIQKGFRDLNKILAQIERDISRIQPRLENIASNERLEQERSGQDGSDQ